MYNLRLIFLLLTALVLSAAPVCAQDVLAPGDTIRVWVKGEPDLTVERVIGSDGSISYPLLGTVPVHGLKPYEAARTIARLLDDGYIRQPLVQIDVTSRAPARSEPPAIPAVSERPSSSPPEPQAAPSEAPAAPLPDARTEVHPPVSPAAAPAPKAVAPKPVSKRLIEVVDGKNGAGIGSAALFLGGKIYQSNRLGQMLIEQSSGRIILIADGYKILQGPLERFLRAGNPARIVMDRITVAGVITVKVIDIRDGKPLPGVKVTLDDMSVKTNSQGIFRMRDIRKEFGEIKLEMAGYKPLRKIIDFKGPAEQVLALKRDE
ncbi:MAG TPA: polysaccharide biosynthesis/export family protein [Candidatus Ozemobacteraceae bacterium]|nr:polysaccharide biosynthesis/export family protein [Candidatus Ozemobacteraceae bacterium]